MPGRNETRHVISTTQPPGLDPGGEWFNPSTNKLYKNVAVNGTSVEFQEVFTALSGTVSTSANNLVLNTANGTSSGSISIIAGPNGDIQLSPNGAGAVEITTSLRLSGGGGLTLKDSTTSSGQVGLEITNNATSNGSVVLKRNDGTWVSTWYAVSGQYGFLDSEWGNWDITKVPNGALTIRISGATQTLLHTGTGQNLVGTVNASLWTRTFALMGS